MSNPEETVHTCIFCGRSKLTKEHVWPKWIGSIIFDVQAGRTIRPYIRDGITWETAFTNVVLRRVCATCNSGWMSALETAVIPILGPLLKRPDVAHVLSPADQYVLARWITKQVLVGDMIQQNGALIPTRFYEQFHSKRLPFRNSAILLGASSSMTHGSRVSRRDVSFGNSQITAGQGTNGQVTTCSILGVMFQFMQYFGSERVSFVDVMPWTAVLTPIWPPTGQPTVWRSDRFTVTDDTFHDFARRDDFDLV